MDAHYFHCMALNPWEMTFPLTLDPKKTVFKISALKFKSRTSKICGFEKYFTSTKFTKSKKVIEKNV